MNRAADSRRTGGQIYQPPSGGGGEGKGTTCTCTCGSFVSLHLELSW